MEATYPVRFTEEQLMLLRRTISERANFVKNYPISGDGDLAQKLFELEEIICQVTRIL